MDYNIINKYIDFVKGEYYNYFKILLGKNYQKQLCAPFIDRYILVRYYNETDYYQEKDFINRLNRELVLVFKNNYNEENEDVLKNIVALFGYLVYFDDVGFIDDMQLLIDTLVSDENIKICHEDAVGKEIKKWYIQLRKNKDRFNDTVVSKDFTLIERRVQRKLYELYLQHNVKVSNLYSEYAIDKAYNSGVINEDKLFITCILGSLLVLNNAINLDFSRYYVVDMATSLFDKVKKFNRLFSVLDNMLAKKFISFRITYSDYKKNKDKINKLINDGYAFGVVIDEEFNGNVNELVLFMCIYIDSDNEYNALLDEKKQVMPKIIKL